MFAELMGQISNILQTSLFTIGEASITLSTLLFLVIGISVFIYLTKLIQRWIVDKLLTRAGMEIGNREATGNIIRYTLLVVGLIVILQLSGIDLTILNVLAGTLGIGIGFGLQNIINNFVSGLIILFERPIKVGDRIEVGNVHGRVIHLGARSATVLTNDNVSIIIPNQKFVTENIINWSHTDDKRRFIIPVTVALSSDPYLVEQLLLEAANEEPEVLKDPPPGVRFFWFGENGMHFELRAWSNSLIHHRGLLMSKLNFAIYDKFKAHKVELVTPQREVFVRREPVGPSFEQ
jgi:small-conductance mechanosensitive channel